jgi:quercetin dioxygenase-like cupin family protein
MGIKSVGKKWGSEEWIVNCPEYCGKYLRIKRGGKSSYHYHKVKKETFYCVSGKVILNVEDKLYNLSEPVTINPAERHYFEAITDSVILEISTEHKDEDVYRLTNSIYNG